MLLITPLSSLFSGLVVLFLSIDLYDFWDYRVTGLPSFGYCFVIPLGKFRFNFGSNFYFSSGPLGRGLIVDYCITSGSFLDTLFSTSVFNLDTRFSTSIIMADYMLFSASLMPPSMLTRRIIIRRCRIFIHTLSWSLIPKPTHNHVVYTGSRLITVVKQRRTRLVLVRMVCLIIR